MQPSRRPCLYASLALLAASLLAARTRADTLTITSTPPGAEVEIDGLRAGTTPYTTKYPGGYFHKTHTVFGARLDHSIAVRISKDGYLTKQITITQGPFEWVAVNGRHHGKYFLLKSHHFDIKLETISYGSGGPVETVDGEGPMRPRSATTLREEEDRATRADTGSVEIASDPPGAEIYVDGKFVGQTPSTVRLPAGSHHVKVKARGRVSWTRDLEVLKNSQMTLRAILKTSP
jgi:hypothetical protein